MELIGSYLIMSFLLAIMLLFSVPCISDSPPESCLYEGSTCSTLDQEATTLSNFEETNQSRLEEIPTAGLNETTETMMSTTEVVELTTGVGSPGETSQVTEKVTETVSTEQSPQSTTAEYSTPTTTEMHILQEDHLCLCDLKAYECDINCCCDRDCTSSQRRIFTSCEEVQNYYDTKFCYKSKFIYQNMTRYDYVNNNSLFCLVRDNLPSQYKYITSPILNTIEKFNKKIIRKKYFNYHKDIFIEPKFSSLPYHQGSLIWKIRKNSILTFDIQSPSLGLNCLVPHTLRYLEGYSTHCPYWVPNNKTDCEGTLNWSMKSFVSDFMIITSPALVNTSESLTYDKVCKNKTCINITPYICIDSPTTSKCKKGIPLAPQLKNNTCTNMVTKVQYLFLHNGTNGIQEVKGYIWMRNETMGNRKQFLQKVSVRFHWAGTQQDVFERSGNPGYLVRKSVIAGRKIISVMEDGTEKEAIELSLNKQDWLSVMGVEHGLCSQFPRSPILFGVDGHFSCSLFLRKENFSKDSCIVLQRNIFNIQTGEDFTNATVHNHFNKFVATFGNSKVEETGDWVQVLVDWYPTISSHVVFKSEGNILMCKGVISELNIDVVFSNVGSFSKPQAKILGVLFRFGTPSNLRFSCGPIGCKESNVKSVLRLHTNVNFIDVTEPAVKEFAQPPGFEARLPHDFFYPFFSCSHRVKLNHFALFALFALFSLF